MLVSQVLLVNALITIITRRSRLQIENQLRSYKPRSCRFSKIFRSHDLFNESAIKAKQKSGPANDSVYTCVFVKYVF